MSAACPTKGNAGFRKGARNALTSGWNTVYDGIAQGIETDPDCRWMCVCEEHGTCVGHRALADAKETVKDATNWCDECREIAKKREGV